MEEMKLRKIGEVHSGKSGFCIQLKEEFIPALQGLDDFSHLLVLWWFSETDNVTGRSMLQYPKPYKSSPDMLGIFATRAPFRPNPVAVDVVQVLSIDYQKGVIEVPFIDAKNGSPILDIKPYTPSIDRVESPQVPKWCSNWPKSTEESGYFDWSQVFNF